MIFFNCFESFRHGYSCLTRCRYRLNSSRSIRKSSLNKTPHKIYYYPYFRSVHGVHDGKVRFRRGNHLFFMFLFFFFFYSFSLGKLFFSHMVLYSNIDVYPHFLVPCFHCEFWQVVVRLYV